jgi:Putative lumazine-binding
MSARQEISSVLDLYFAGLYAGDIDKLRSAFHPTAVLWGEVKGQPYYRALEEYLGVVRARQSPQALGETFAMDTLGIEVHGAIALAKVRCPMLGFEYLDLLSLLEQGGRWAIVAKVFTHQPNSAELRLKNTTSPM